MKIQLYKCSAHSYRFIILPVPKAEYTYCVQAALLKTISYKIVLTAAQTHFSAAFSYTGLQQGSSAEKAVQCTRGLGLL